MINSFAIHTTGQVVVPATDIATGKIQTENNGNFVVTKIIGVNSVPWISFKIIGEPNNNYISEDFISISPFSVTSSYAGFTSEAGYSRKNGHPLFIVPNSSTLKVMFKNTNSSDFTSCLGLLGFYVNDKGQRINDGNIPVNILNRLL